MKTLIITTGTSKIILSRWLPLIRGIGQYQGDVLVIDYGDINYFGIGPDIKGPVHLIDKFRTLLKKETGVVVIEPVRKLNNVFIDRLAVIQDYLKNCKTEYDVIGIMDGNDTIIWGDINPLIEQATDIICYIQEHFSNLLSIWGDFGPRKFCRDNFADLMNKPIINGGVCFGPRAEMSKLLKIIFAMVVKYGSEPSDQVYMDIAFYRNMVKCKEVGNEWNYTHAVIGHTADGRAYGPRRPIYRDGKAFKIEDGTPVIIEHRTGTGWRIWGGPSGANKLNSDKPIGIMAEYNSFNWLFPDLEIEKEETCKRRNWLFTR